MGTAIRESWSRLEKIMQAGDDKQTDQGYTEWARFYDEDLVNLSHTGTAISVRLAMEFVHNTKTAKLLDVAAGTGLCSFTMRQAGYIGIMDALEPNAAMLAVAEKKGIFRRLVQADISPYKDMPVEQDSYDTVTCTGALAPNHVDEGSLMPMLRALKPGGVLVFNTRITEYSQGYKQGLDQVVADLVNGGKIKKLLEKQIKHYEGKKGEENNMLAQIYVYEKI